MKPVPCPKCGARIALEDSAQGERVRCPLCGHRFDAPIEVRAQTPGGADDGQAPPQDDGSDPDQAIENGGRRLDAEIVRLLGGRNAIQGRVITIHRQAQGNPGCCMAGCTLLIIAAVIFLMGLQSLFRAIFSA